LETINGYMISLIKRYNSEMNRLNLFLLHMSGLSLTLLVSLQSFYIPHNPKSLLLLQLSWCGFGASILFGLLYFLFGLRKLVREKKFVEGKTCNIADDLLLNCVRSEMPNSQGTSVVLMFSALCFVSGLAGIVVFAILNIGHIQSRF